MKAITFPNGSKDFNFVKNPVINEFYDYNDGINFKNFTVPVPMTEKEVAPPLHVWDKIVRILDEQDSKKQFLKHSALYSFQPQSLFQTKTNHNNRYAIAIVCAAFVIGLVWFLS